MKMKIINKPRMVFCIGISLLTACTSTNQNEKQMNAGMEKLTRGTYGYDSIFFADNNIETIELKQKDSEARILVIPAYQGRVMTSSATGSGGASFGWINYDLIESGDTSSQFNPYGGEERLWLGPEGGPFSIYFADGAEQVYENWVVPKEIDTEPFEVVAKADDSVHFRNEFSLTNASGTEMKIGIERTVSLFSKQDAEKALNLSLDPSLDFVAYETENTLINNGTVAWTEDTGFLSIWLLSMFNPSEKGVVFIPFKKGDDGELGKIVTDDYFGKVPSDRLLVRDGVIFFKVDGKHRSKIGISPERSLPWCGSYDPEQKTLTLLWYSKPQGQEKYVNSKWGEQEDPLKGDAVNSYNDGPVADGSIMGPFYEIESSSPAALLEPGGALTHTQRIFHISGDENKLNDLTQSLFSLSISEIKQAFN